MGMSSLLLRFGHLEAWDPIPFLSIFSFLSISPYRPSSPKTCIEPLFVSRETFQSVNKPTSISRRVVWLRRRQTCTQNDSLVLLLCFTWNRPIDNDAYFLNSLVYFMQLVAILKSSFVISYIFLWKFSIAQSRTVSLQHAWRKIVSLFHYLISKLAALKRVANSLHPSDRHTVAIAVTSPVQPKSFSGVLILSLLGFLPIKGIKDFILDSHITVTSLSDNQTSMLLLHFYRRERQYAFSSLRRYADSSKSYP